MLACILLWLPGLIATHTSRAWLLCLLLGCSLLGLLYLRVLPKTIHSINLVNLLSLTAFWASIFVWTFGWKIKLLAWPVEEGIDPFAGPVGCWMLMDSALFIFGLVQLLKIKREGNTARLALFVAPTLLIGLAGTIYYQWE